MARLSLTSLSAAYRIWFSLFWIFLTYVGLGIIWPTYSRASNLVAKKEITDLERFVYDLSRTWEYSVWYLCIILSAGCLVGCFPSGPTRTKWIRSFLIHQSIYFLCDSSACLSTYSELQSGGINAIAKFCQDSKPTDLPIGLSLDVDELCGETRPILKYRLLGAILVWKLVGLTVFLLTLIRYKCALRDEMGTRGETGNDAQEGTVLVTFSGDSSTSSEQKV